MALCFFTWIINIAFPTIAPAAGPGLTSWSSWQSFYGACLKSFLGANLRSDFMLDAINSCVRMNLAGFLKLGLSWKESTLSDIPLQVRLFPWHSHCLRLDWASHRVFAGLEWRAPSSWWNFKKDKITFKRSCSALIVKASTSMFLRECCCVPNPSTWLCKPGLSYSDQVPTYITWWTVFINCQHVLAWNF